VITTSMFRTSSEESTRRIVIGAAAEPAKERLRLA
jgi:hypothetical protein